MRRALEASRGCVIKVGEHADGGQPWSGKRRLRRVARWHRARACTAFERAICAFVVYFQVRKGECIRVAFSPFAVARAVRRLEHSGALQRARGAPSGFVAGPPPIEVLAAIDRAQAGARV